MKREKVKIMDRKSSHQSKVLNVRVSPYMYDILVDTAKASNLTISDVIRATLNDRFLQSQKTKRKN